MSDIFISYSHQDDKWASNLSQALKAYGWSLWWDPELRLGEEYDQIIEKELINATCVIVGWSESSINSTWVKGEAHEALGRKKIIPVLINEVNPPIEFRYIHCFNLTSWDLTINSPILGKFVKQIEKIIGPAPNQNVIHEKYQDTLNFFSKLLDYDTGLISSIVKITRKANKIVDARIIHLNPIACRFYNIDSISYCLTGNEAIDILSAWVNDDDLKAFTEDQDRLADNLLFGHECKAEIPIRINNRHPYKEFRNQAFLPIIFAFSGRFKVADHVEELLAVSYANLTSLCKTIGLT